jgi:ACT domain-containing protein
MRTTFSVTALGPDSHGLLAQVATTMAGHEADIDDVSQTVANGRFTMIMFVSFDQGETTIAQLKEALETTGARAHTRAAAESHEPAVRPGAGGA